jgi:dynein heavy chain, axonemal
VLAIQPRVSSTGGGMTPDEVVLARSTQLQGELPASLDRDEGKKEMFKTNNGLLPSLTTVLVQEIEKFNRLLGVMRNSLRDLKDAIHGFIVMSESLDSMYLSLQNGQVPDMWAKAGYPSLKPLASWYTDLIQRVEFMQNWLVNGNPKSYWISGMFFPQGFMTGALQTHARQYKIAIDRLNMSFQIMTEETPEEVEELPEDGVYVHGFYMDGARFNREEAVVDDQNPVSDS